MKYEKLINELNNVLGSAAKQSQKHHETLKFFLQQFKAEEQNLRKKLEKENSKTSRKKLKRELGTVKKAYELLGA